MHLIYAYIRKFKNYVEQEITFDHSFAVSFQNNQLFVKYYGTNKELSSIRSNRKPNHLHLLVGKTGSGKTNLLQLIGMKHEDRVRRRCRKEDDAYFLLYQINEQEFFAEICNINIRQFPVTIPDVTPIGVKASSNHAVRSVRFALQAKLEEHRVYSEFTVIPEAGWYKNRPEEIAHDIGIIINSYDIHAFITPPHPDKQDDHQDLCRSWLRRLIIPYHRTALWQVCDYIREYLSDMEPGEAKRQASFRLSTHNFADKYPIQLPAAIEKEYWTFYEKQQKEPISLRKATVNGKAVFIKRKTCKTNKEMLLHDLWTDYAIYLRKWIETIHSYAEDIPEENLDASGTIDVYQEAVDHYVSKDYPESFDPAILPDGRKMSIEKRCLWLAEYIDRRDNRDPHGMLWQVADDIKDIIHILSKLDDKYFTMDTFSIPVADMILPEYKKLFETLFERMEAYLPDDLGIFIDRLLPYTFTHLSTGEYQYAKVLGALDEFLSMSCTSSTRQKTDKIVLFDEPEAYMHPELARQFMKKLYEITDRHLDDSSLQVIIGTHSPFMLSDVFPSEIIRLDIDRITGNAIVHNGSQRPYFGANMHTILADSFFLDYTIGEYARNFLQDAFDRLKGYCEESVLDDQAITYIHSMRSFLPNIGDTLIRRAFELALQQLENKERYCHDSH